MPVYFKEIKHRFIEFTNSRGDKCAVNVDDVTLTFLDKPRPAIRFQLKNGSDFTIELESIEELKRLDHELWSFGREDRIARYKRDRERREALKRKIQELNEEIRKADIAS